MATATKANRTNNMNLAALQQRDPFISDIVETASQVALYSFNSATQKWVKTEIEGTLFVYRRSAFPINGFMILNQLGLNNLIQPITKELEFQLHDPYLLYRNTKAIYAIWFYDKDECAMIGQQMNSLLQLEVGQRQRKANNSTRQRRASESDSVLQEQFEVATSSPKESRQVDIIQLLSNAQHEYDKVQGKSSLAPKPMVSSPVNGAIHNCPLLRPLPVKVRTSDSPDGATAGACSSPPLDPHPMPPPTTTAISLDELFRKASLSHPPPSSQPRYPQQIPGPHRSQSESETGGLSDTGGTSPKQSLHPILQKIMGGPPSRVERVERHQRSNSRSPTLPGPAGDRLPVLPTSSDNLTALSHSTPNGPLLHASPPRPPHPQHPTSLDVPPGASNLTTGHSSSDSDDRSFHSSTQLSPTVKTPSTSLLKPHELQPSSSSPNKQAFGADCLLTPNVFMTSRSSPPSSRSLTYNHASQDVVNASKSSSGGNANSMTDDGINIAALTKEQLQQSLIYLLKTDSGFLKAIHEAYLRSLHAELDAIRH